MSLKGSKTETNLKDAFAGESQANRRYLYFAAKADVEGYNDVAAVFRSTAEGETGHAHGHLEYLEEVGDPATGLPMGSTAFNLEAAIAGETHEYTDMYPGYGQDGARRGFRRNCRLVLKHWQKPNVRTRIVSRRRWTRWTTRTRLEMGSRYHVSKVMKSQALAAWLFSFELHL